MRRELCGRGESYTPLLLEQNRGPVGERTLVNYRRLAVAKPQRAKADEGFTKHDEEWVSWAISQGDAYEELPRIAFVRKWYGAKLKNLSPIQTPLHLHTPPEDLEEHGMKEHLFLRRKPALTSTRQASAAGG